MARARALIASLISVAALREARAQQTGDPSVPHTVVESRADVIIGRGTTGEAGLGAQIPLGYYVRLGIAGAVGATFRGDSTLASFRGDVLARFLLDPFREKRWALSFGGGVSLPYVDGDKRVQPYLTTVVDLEGPRWHRVTPAVQIGLGGGTRIGVLFRGIAGPWR